MILDVTCWPSRFSKQSRIWCSTWYVFTSLLVNTASHLLHFPPCYFFVMSIFPKMECLWWAQRIPSQRFAIQQSLQLPWSSSLCSTQMSPKKLLWLRGESWRIISCRHWDQIQTVFWHHALLRFRLDLTQKCQLEFMTYIISINFPVTLNDFPICLGCPVAFLFEVTWGLRRKPCFCRLWSCKRPQEAEPILPLGFSIDWKSD